MLDVDALGLDDLDRKVLRTVIEKFDGGPVGLETIAASLSEEGDTIMDVVEPYFAAARLFGPHAARPGRHPSRLRASWTALSGAGRAAAGDVILESSLRRLYNLRKDLLDVICSTFRILAGFY